MHEDVVRRGRLSGERSKDLKSFLSSMDADRTIVNEDILVDIAHLLMLHRQEIISHEHMRVILKSLLLLQKNGVPDSAFDEGFEDIHAGIEALLISSAGEESGGRLHMGRSRNDEVAACIRLRLRDSLLGQMNALLQLRKTLIDMAEKHCETIMPGFTHLQYAQPTTLAHYLLAYEEAFSRDFERLSEAYSRVNRSPLGAAAFASTGYRIDRDYPAKLLGFDGIVTNTMDAVASRDFALEVLGDLTILMATVSRLCEEIVLWSSPLAGFISIDEVFCSTSSIMPQKKNPDTAEIMRAKTGSVLGAFTSAVVITKGIPMSYNRDFQELNPHLWRAVKDSVISITLLSEMLRTIRFDTKKMKGEAGRGFSTATDLADFLVLEYGLPFRTAHSIVGRAVRKGTIDMKSLDEAAAELTKQTLTARGLTDEKVKKALSAEGSVGARDHPGGPAAPAVHVVIRHAGKKFEHDRKLVESRNHAARDAIRSMLDEARRLAE
jgi:argininosuccinate lyase